MTQILVTLEQNADSNLIQRIIENIKGVFKTSVETIPAHDGYKKQESARMKLITQLTDSFDPTLLDMDDERTRYIMSK